MNVDLNNEMFSAAFWDARYSSHSQLWSGQPNARLVEHASRLHTGRALDVGCGEGADAIWLADLGWQVTALDISTVALDRGASRAAEVGAEVAARIDWRMADLLSWKADEHSAYDLVSAQFIHLPRHAREALFAGLADSVAVAGTLLIVAHDPSDLKIPGLRHQAPERHRAPEQHRTHERHQTPELFYSAADVAQSLPATDWDIQVAQPLPRDGTDADGQSIVVHDAVLCARRLPALSP